MTDGKKDQLKRKKTLEYELRRLYRAGELTDQQIAELKEAEFPFDAPVRRTAKSVVRIDDGKRWPSCSAAEKELGITQGWMSDVCNMALRGKWVAIKNQFYCFESMYSPDMDLTEIRGLAGWIVNLETGEMFPTTTEAAKAAGTSRSVLLKIERRWQKRLTVIKQKAVSSSRHAKNVRKYINGKDALARGGWNLPYNKYWYAKMARTRKSFGHDKPARAGAKNTIMYHQVLAFLPEECSCNGGKMTPDACMAYAEQWLAKHYPHQQVILALHEESDKEGKRFAVHMAINRTDLLTGKRLWEGTGAQ